MNGVRRTATWRTGDGALERIEHSPPLSRSVTGALPRCLSFLFLLLEQRKRHHRANCRQRRLPQLQQPRPPTGTPHHTKRGNGRTNTRARVTIARGDIRSAAQRRRRGSDRNLGARRIARTCTANGPLGSVGRRRSNVCNTLFQGARGVRNGAVPLFTVPVALCPLCMCVSAVTIPFRSLVRCDSCLRCFSSLFVRLSPLPPCHCPLMTLPLLPRPTGMQSPHSIGRRRNSTHMQSGSVRRFTSCVNMDTCPPCKRRKCKRGWRESRACTPFRRNNRRKQRQRIRRRRKGAAGARMAVALVAHTDGRRSCGGSESRGGRARQTAD
jgi:hypothetical protein